MGSTNDAYAEAFLGPGAPLEADAITVHPQASPSQEKCRSPSYQLNAVIHPD